MFRALDESKLGTCCGTNNGTHVQQHMAKDVTRASLGPTVTNASVSSSARSPTIDLSDAKKATIDARCPHLLPIRKARGGFVGV